MRCAKRAGVIQLDCFVATRLAMTVCKLRDGGMRRAGFYFGSHVSQFFAKASTLSRFTGMSAVFAMGWEGFRLK